MNGPANAEYVDCFLEWGASLHRLIDAAGSGWGTLRGTTNENIHHATAYNVAITNTGSNNGPAPDGDRRILFTQINYFVGLSPGGLEEGDQGCVLEGLNTPFLIRS